MFNYTPHQLKEYAACISNLKVGDKVKFYTSSDYSYRVLYRSFFTYEAEVVALHDGYKFYCWIAEGVYIPLVILGSDHESFSLAGGFSQPVRSLALKAIELNCSYSLFHPISTGILIASVIKKPI